MADVAQRFFCHECSVEIPSVGPDFTCPTCNSGFIEELSSDQPPPVVGEDDHDEDHMHDLGNVLGPLEALLPGLLGGVGGGGGGAIPRPRGPTHPTFSQSGPALLGGGIRPRTHHIRITRGGGRQGGQQNLGMDQAALENALQDFLGNLAGMGMGPPGGAQFHFIGPGAGGGFQLHGNPGDYAWGRGGLDAIITQMLNHMDGTGPPPMEKDKIQSIPVVKISEEQMSKSQSCSVCWEDFTVGEEVRLLECEHCFHGPCIIPWLELHGTCPVCRKELGGGGGGGGGAEEQSEDSFHQHSTSTEDSGETDGASGVSPSSSSGGLTGLIQSALNQVFNSPWSSSRSNSEAETSVTSSTPTPVTSSNSATATATTSTTNSTTSSTTTAPATESSSEDDTPAARRQRLDSEFVDLDFD